MEDIARIITKVFGMRDPYIKGHQQGISNQFIVLRKLWREYRKTGEFSMNLKL